MGELADRPCTSQKPNCRILMHLVEKITPEERSLDERYSTMPSGGGESQIARGNTELLSLARPATYIADLVGDNNDLSGEYRRRLMEKAEYELDLLAQMWGNKFGCDTALVQEEMNEDIAGTYLGGEFSTVFNRWYETKFRFTGPYVPPFENDTTIKDMLKTVEDTVDAFIHTPKYVGEAAYEKLVRNLEAAIQDSRKFGVIDFKVTSATNVSPKKSRTRYHSSRTRYHFDLRCKTSGDDRLLHLVVLLKRLRQVENNNAPNVEAIMFESNDMGRGIYLLRLKNAVYHGKEQERRMVRDTLRDKVIADMLKEDMELAVQCKYDAEDHGCSFMQSADGAFHQRGGNAASEQGRSGEKQGKTQPQNELSDTITRMGSAEKGGKKQLPQIEMRDMAIDVRRAEELPSDEIYSRGKDEDLPYHLADAGETKGEEKMDNPLLGNSTLGSIAYPLQRGDRVTVTGTSRDDLNGQNGTVKDYDAVIERFHVILEDGQVLALRNRNLKKFVHDHDLDL